MNQRAAELIDLLGLAPHPEGGHYAELYRSQQLVRVEATGLARSAVTTIYFLLAQGQHSRWHRVLSDEIWHFYEGDPLELFWVDAEGERCERRRLGPATARQQPVAVVPAGCWQAARPAGAYSLVGCSVGPGFDFADFRMLVDDVAAQALVRQHCPDLLAMIE